MPYQRVPDPEMEAIRAQLLAAPRPSDMAERRQRLDAIGARYALPADIRVEPVRANGVRAEWTSSPEADASRVLIFLHGGGYVSGSLDSHRHLVAQLGREARARTLALDYRLAPEHPFPAALDDALAGYRFVLEQGVAPERIALCGESAGGGLTVATLTRLRDTDQPLPACAWLSSPWLDLEMNGASMTEQEPVDPLITRPYLQELASLFLNGAGARNPLASPLHADLRGLPPMLVQVGSAETLLDDAVRIARAAGVAEVPVRLEIWPQMIHAFTLFHPQLHAGRRALTEVGAFVQRHTVREAR